MKMSGAGNDFVLVDNRSKIFDGVDLSVFVSKICERRNSIGADGVIFVDNSDRADFMMRYFNADGSEAETCGNGARCVARFAYLNGIVGTVHNFETKAGIYEAEVTGSSAKLKMGDATELRLNFKLELPNYGGDLSFVNTGVPHAVGYVDDLENLELVSIGRSIRHHETFAPAGTNANFVRVVGEHELDIRTYERGVEGETLACGTGSIAGAITSALNGMVSPPVKVNTASRSTLKIDFEVVDGVPRDISLEGSARLIISGIFTEEAWNH